MSTCSWNGGGNKGSVVIGIPSMVAAVGAVTSVSSNSSGKDNESSGHSIMAVAVTLMVEVVAQEEA